MICNEILAALEREGNPNPQDAAFLAHYFKTGKGEYGEGDVFIGVRVPAVRRVAAAYRTMPLGDVETLLESPIHELRLCAAIIMVLQAKRGTTDQKRQLYKLYLRRTDRLNNWDIVDLSCREVVGGYLLENPSELPMLHKLAISTHIWERRIAIISTAQFMRAGQLDPTFTIAEMLLGDKHDLIHKAVGWMLREAGKRDADRLRSFLHEHYGQLPRTTLRYAIERFLPLERQYFLGLKK